MKVLGIETSCDDTSVALYDSEQGVLENLVSSQVDLHDHFGGVVPELASRAHLVNLLPLIEVLLERRRLALADLDGVASRPPRSDRRPLVGLSTAKALCWSARRWWGPSSKATSGQPAVRPLELPALQVLAAHRGSC
jgi:N6-L-threonylcarbamoyladenine synthase